MSKKIRMTNVEYFKKLHQEAEPLLLGNVWNVQSAKAFQKLNFKALGTSSAAIAHSLGYNDGEQITFDEYFFIIERIVKSVSLPVSVDLESGYSNTIEGIANHIQRLVDIGVVGINLEDSYVKNGERKIADKTIFFNKILGLTEELLKRNIQVFINVRTDTFLLGLPNALEETLERISLLQELNIDGFFIPCITNELDIERVTKFTNLPINVMCMPDLPNFTTLRELSVKRISSGNFFNDKIYGNLEHLIIKTQEENSYKPLFL